MTKRKFLLRERVLVSINAKEYEAIITHIDIHNYNHEPQYEVTIYDKLGKEIDWEIAMLESEIIDIDAILLDCEE